MSSHLSRVSRSAVLMFGNAVLARLPPRPQRATIRSPRRSGRRRLGGSRSSERRTLRPAQLAADGAGYVRYAGGWATWNHRLTPIQRQHWVAWVQGAETSYGSCGHSPVEARLLCNCASDPGLVPFPLRQPGPCLGHCSPAPRPCSSCLIVAMRLAVNAVPRVPSPRCPSPRMTLSRQRACWSAADSPCAPRPPGKRLINAGCACSHLRLSAG